MGLSSRLVRHARLSYGARNQERPPTPPFLVLFINSLCNLRCDHCFYWDSLNKHTDLTLAELSELSRSLGPIDNLNLSGGEPFLRTEFSQICTLFAHNNHVRQIYCPTNGYFTARTESHLRAILNDAPLQLFTVELSLDGMEQFHDRFRGKSGSFQRAMETYDMLAELQSADPRLQIHAITTATAENLLEARELSEFLHRRCPKMSRHNIALLRGARKRASLEGPLLPEYMELTRYVLRLWSDRKNQSSAEVVDPILHWAKEKTCNEETQIVPCRAGILTGVVYANGDVSVCEQHAVLGNIRQQPFLEIWHSDRAVQLRKAIWAKQCHCTNEIFLWSSLAFQPLSLLGAMTATNTLSKALVSLGQ